MQYLGFDVLDVIRVRRVYSNCSTEIDYPVDMKDLEFRGDFHSIVLGSHATVGSPHVEGQCVAQITAIPHLEFYLRAKCDLIDWQLWNKYVPSCFIYDTVHLKMISLYLSFLGYMKDGFYGYNKNSTIFGGVAISTSVLATFTELSASLEDNGLLTCSAYTSSDYLDDEDDVVIKCPNVQDVVHDSITGQFVVENSCTTNLEKHEKLPEYKCHSVFSKDEVLESLCEDKDLYKSNPYLACTTCDSTGLHFVESDQYFEYPGSSPEWSVENYSTDFTCAQTDIQVVCYDISSQCLRYVDVMPLHLSLKIMSRNYHMVKKFFQLCHIVRHKNGFLFSYIKDTIIKCVFYPYELDKRSIIYWCVRHIVTENSFMHTRAMEYCFHVCPLFYLVLKDWIETNSYIHVPDFKAYNQVHTTPIQYYSRQASLDGEHAQDLIMVSQGFINIPLPTLGIGPDSRSVMNCSSFTNDELFHLAYLRGSGPPFSSDGYIDDVVVSNYLDDSSVNNVW